MIQDTVEIDRETLTVLRNQADRVHNEYGATESYRAITRAGKALGMEHPLPQGGVDSRSDLEALRMRGVDVDGFLGWLAQQPHADEDTNVSDYR